MRAGAATTAMGIIPLGCRISSTLRPPTERTTGVGANVPILFDRSSR